MEGLVDGWMAGWLGRRVSEWMMDGWMSVCSEAGALK